MLKEFCKKSIEYCTKEYGTSSYKPVPKIRFTQNISDYGLYKFNLNVICINLKKHIEPTNYSVNLLEISNTITHEYQHYLQDHDEYCRQVDIAYKQSSGNTSNIKYERIARHVANRDEKKCFKYSIDQL
jgi:Zn-dependent peptidase ImmA (M78 family)